MFILVLAMVLLACPLQAITKEEGGSLVFFNELSEEQTFKGDNFDIRLDKNSIATIKTNEDGSKILELSGTGTINVKDQHSLNNIGNATIIIGAGNEIEYAAFISLKDQLFKFIYEKEEISITANSGSKILYDTKNRKLSGNNLESINYKDKNIKSSQGLTEINFNEETNDIVEIILPPKSQYSNNGFIYSSESAFKIYLDGRDIKKSKENVVSTFENLISSKGKIRIENKEAKIVYEGNDKEVYTEYNSEIQTFDIKSGDAKISNGISTTEIKNNREMLDLKKGIAESFSYRYSLYKGKEENVYYTQINQAEDGNLKVVSFKDDKENIIAVYSFGEGLNNIGLMGMERIIGEIKSLRAKDTKKDIAPYLPPEEFSQLQAIDKKITELKETNEEIPKELLEGKDILELKNMQGEVERLMEDDRENEAWAKINQYLKEERSPEASALGNLELYGVFETMKDEKYKKLAEKSFQKAVDVYKELKKDEEKKEDATLKLGSLFLQTGKLNEALSEFDEIMSSSDNKEAVSIAQVGKAMIKLNQNLPEASLINLKKAIESDKNNQNAKELYKNLQTNILHTIRDNKYKQFEQQYTSFNEKWNLGGAELTNTLNFIAAEFGVMEEDIEKLERKEENTGTAALGTQFLSKLAEEGVNLEELSKASHIDRKKIISKTFGIESLNEQEVTSLFLSKTSEERRALIKNSLGYEPNFDKLPDNLASSWLAYSNVRRELLMKEKGASYADADKTLNDIAFLTLAAERDWDTALVIAGGNVKKAKEILKDKGMTEGEINEKSKLMEFDFKTGRDYDEASNIEKTWKNSVAGAINIKNAAWFLVPGAVAGRAAPLLKYVPGAIRAVEGTATLKNELMLNRLITSEWVAKNMPALATKYEGILAKSAGFATEVLREEAAESAMGIIGGKVLGELGNNAELVAAYAPMLKAGKYPIANKIFEFDGERLAGFEFKSREVLDSFMQQNQIKKLTDDVFEVNGEKFVAVVANEKIKTKGLVTIMDADSIDTQEIITRKGFEEAKKAIRENSAEGLSVWSKRYKIELKDSDGKHVVDFLTQTEAQRLRLLMRSLWFGGGGASEIGGSVSIKIKGGVAIAGETNLPKKGEVLFYSREDLGLPETNIRYNTKTIREDFKYHRKKFEEAIEKIDLKEIGMPKGSYDELTSDEKRRVLEIFGNEANQDKLKLIKDKYPFHISSIKLNAEMLLNEIKFAKKSLAQEIEKGLDLGRSFEIKKHPQDMSPDEVIDAVTKISNTKVSSSALEVRYPLGSAGATHTHNVVTRISKEGNKEVTLIEGLVNGEIIPVIETGSDILDVAIKQTVEENVLKRKCCDAKTLTKTVETLRESGQAQLKYERFLIRQSLSTKDFAPYVDNRKANIRLMLERELQENRQIELIHVLERDGFQVPKYDIQTGRLLNQKERLETFSSEAETVFFSDKKKFEETLLLKQIEIKELLDGLEKGKDMQTIFSTVINPSLSKVSDQDLISLWKGDDWAELPNGRKIKSTNPTYLGGDTIAFQIDNDPNIHVFRRVGNDYVEIQRVSVDSVKAYAEGMSKSASIETTSPSSETSAMSLTSQINPQNQNDFLQEYFVQAGAKVTIIDSDTMAFQAKGTREITWSMSQAQDFFKVHGPGTQGVKVVKGVQTPNDGFDISEVNRIQTEAIQKAANLKKIPGTVTIHAKNQKNIWRTLIFPVDKNGQINLRHADFK